MTGLPSLQSVLAAGVQTLRSAGNEDATSDVRRLLGAVLGVGADRLAGQADRLLEPAESAAFAAALAARLSGRPVARIIGRRAFWKHDFIVTDDVLDPRPDTETLVAAALEVPFASVIDLGTGSGCIVLSLLAERPLARGTGTDVSAAALAVAARNAAALGLDQRIRLILSDWFSAIDQHFDLIVANPPYIAATEMAGLAPDVRDHDPHIALTPGGDGLDCYRQIAATAGRHLVSGGHILLEIGPTQGQPVMALLAGAGFADLRIRPDLDGRDRVVSARMP